MTKLCIVSGEDVSKRIPIAKRLEKVGYEVTLSGSENPAIFHKNKMEYIHYTFQRKFSVNGDLKTVKTLQRIFDNSDFNIIQSFDTKPAVFVPYALRHNKNLKVIRTITGLGKIFSDDTLKNRALRQLYTIMHKKVAPYVSHTVFQNDADYEFFLEKGYVQSNKASVIKSSGIDMTTFNQQSINNTGLKEKLNLKPAVKTFILISRLMKHKGIEEYLKAARICQQKGLNYNFLLVGQLDSNEKVISMEMLEQYRDIVQYLGRRSDVKELLSISDIFVLPTYLREGIPRVLLEAMAMGLGLITTNVPGCSDVVQHNWNGLIVPIKSPKPLADAMERLAKDEGLLKQFNLKNSKQIQKFSLSVVMASYHQLYQNILETTNRKPIISFG